MGSGSLRNGVRDRTLPGIATGSIRTTKTRTRTKTQVCQYYHYRGSLILAYIVSNNGSTASSNNTTARTRGAGSNNEDGPENCNNIDNDMGNGDDDRNDGDAGEQDATNNGDIVRRSGVPQPATEVSEHRLIYAIPWITSFALGACITSQRPLVSSIVSMS